MENAEKTVLLLVDSNGQKWQLRWSLEEIASKARISKKRALLHFQQVARFVREGKVDPTTLDAERAA